MDEFEITGGEAGIDRRDFIRKSALVGGMVWAAPMISSIGSPAFAVTLPGNGGTNGPDPEGDISYVAFIVVNQGNGRFKFDFEDCPDFGTGAGQVNSPGQCGSTEYTGDLIDPDTGVEFTSFGAAFAAVDAGSQSGFEINTTCPPQGTEWRFEITDDNPEVAEYFFDAGVVRSGAHCCVAQISSDGKTLTAQPLTQAGGCP